MRILKHYLYASLLPAIATILSGQIQMPKDCRQCILLIIVGSGLVLLSLLVLNIFYFLLSINLNRKSAKLTLVIIASLLPSIIYSTYLFVNYYDQTKQYNAEFRIFFPSAIVCLIVGLWTMYIYMNTPTKIIFKQDPNDASS